MMLLKAFDKIDVTTKTCYNVFDKNGNYLYDFSLNYTSDDVETIKAAVLKKIKLIQEKAIVKFVSINSATGYLDVTVIVETA